MAKVSETLQVKGLGSLARKLDAVGKGVRNASTEAVINVLERMKEDAEALVPFRTGKLWKSIDYSVEQVPSNIGPIVGELFANTDYAQYVEFGTSRMAAQPFIRPAYEAHKHELMEEIANSVRRLK